MLMKFKYYPIVNLFLAVAAVLVMTTVSGEAQSGKIDFFTENPEAGGTNLTTGIGQIITWVYWIFYLLGAVFMGVGAFKLKQGDMGGFGKNMAGGATLFFVPAAIKLFRSIGESSVGG